MKVRIQIIKICGEGKREWERIMKEKRRTGRREGERERRGGRGEGGGGRGGRKSRDRVAERVRAKEYGREKKEIVEIRG